MPDASIPQSGSAGGTITALAMVGSLRRHSINQALLRAATELAPEWLEIREFSLTGLPFYCEDLEADGDPPPVARLKSAVHGADLVLMVTPEYNGGPPAVLKNAIDWGSRPPRPQAWDKKPIVITGATPGRLGTALAQRSLRESLAGLNALVMPQPRILVAGARALFDGDLQLADEGLAAKLRNFMVAAGEWSRQFQIGDRRR